MKRVPMEGIVKALEAIRGDRRHLRPDEVVAAATPEDHPLHAYFEWDDNKAGHSYRIVQARDLLRRVEVVVTVESRQVSTVFYQHDADLPAGEAGYLALPTMLSDEDVQERQIRQAFIEAAKHLRRAREIALVLGADVAVIEGLVTEVERVADELQRPSLAS